MLSGIYEQYIKHQSQTKTEDQTTFRIELICPNESRNLVLNNLWDSGWEITRSGPIPEDFSKQLIKAERVFKQWGNLISSK
jgi:hypothetical protein